ncbi:glutathione S-transferase family protein [Chondromyces apiculatus]|uniref:glutathione transferase n=1 Tax=Chondromyces apiculatus DSM 436 TaxID=1192034 RepID=A0A017SXI2_9BACT|nr:glutathione S-transferase N-terminal domain-containing protein [Chondromyces apiculatus]EYF01001.1 Glutathione S-transferase, phi [Chondromyces apiculatus DSM 436]
MKIYGHPMSTCARKVLTVLAEKGHEAEMVLVDLMKGEQKKPEFLKLQPFGVIPVLDDDGFILYESRAIIRYLDQKLSGTSLTPSDPKERALMEQWISVETSYLSPPAMKIVAQKLFVPMRGGQTDEAIVEVGRKETVRTLDIMEQTLSKQEFLAGNSFSLADVSCMPYLGYLFPAGAGDLVTSRPGVAAWWERISSRPSWRKVAG